RYLPQSSTQGKIMESVHMPPEAFPMLNSMRAIGYSFETAVADIIDNSVAAQATDIKLLTEQDPNKESILAIIDNGCGMTSVELLNALKHACTNPTLQRGKDDLGRFGLGLKTASLSQCRNLIVVSKKNGAVSAAEWDLDYVKEEGDWSLKIYSDEETNTLPFINELDNFNCGTIVLWKSFDRLELSNNEIFNALHNQLALAKEYISLVFHRFLAPDQKDNIKKIKISVNGIEIEPKDPFARKLKSCSKICPMETFFLEVDGQNYPITAHGYTLPSQNKLTTDEVRRIGLQGRRLSDDQGFYIYRNHRLISWGSWLRLNKKAQRTKLSRVQVDIPNTMDHLWELDIKKSQAFPPKVIRDRLSELLDDWVQDSTGISTGKGIRRTSQKFIPDAFWEIRDISSNEYVIEVNEENRLLQNFIESLTNDQYTKLRAYLNLLGKTYPIDIVTAKFCDDKKYSSTSSEESGREKTSSMNKELDSMKSNILTLLQMIPKKEDQIEFLNNLRQTTGDNSEKAIFSKVINELLSELENE
ncbi:ATP-binding protein, partial [uncultured Parasutterella sp.]|uniref:ATP-binding protein n=1 Tax=uncultured Parasutterella sp. TaxID=1263098 RepID=UPI0025B424E0